MSFPFACVTCRIASTLFALAALVLIGFVTSPAGFSSLATASAFSAERDAAKRDAAGHDDPASSEGERSANALDEPEADEPPSHEAITAGSWRIAARPPGSVRASLRSVASLPATPGPDRPPPRLRSDLRTKASGIL